MSATVLVLNCGSSSIKYQLVNADSREVLAKGLVERIGEEHGHLRHHGSSGTVESNDVIVDHKAGLRAILAAFDSTGPRLSEVELAAVGHRVVHGGEHFADPVVIDDDIEQTISDLSSLAPLHNPPNLTGINVARQALPDVPHVAVFDTAFHQSLPPVAYTYALDRETAQEHGVRRYGFHGTSVSYVSRQAARLLKREPNSVNLIVLHLGNGASATAVSNGKSIDTSMGLTPLEGLVMGTRTGDIDPGAIFHIRREAGLSVDDLDDLLNLRSGMNGLAGDNDLREVHKRANNGDANARLAREVYCYRIRKYVGAYGTVLGHVDAVVFTAGVGENDPWVRSHSLSGLQRIGIEIDHVRNGSTGGAARVISPDNAEVAVLVVPTNEELEIARQAMLTIDR